MKQGIIIKGSITDSSLMGPLEGQPISELIKLIEEEKVSVNLYLSSSSHRELFIVPEEHGRNNHFSKGCAVVQ